MRTHVTVPDILFQEAEQIAKEMGVSRSELYTLALKGYLQRHRRQQITEQYNRIYGAEISRVDPLLQQLQYNALPQTDWE